MGRELQLGWPGRVLEPVGLAQGGLATDPGGDGMKSGTSQNTSPGFGAFLAFPPPMAACLLGDQIGAAPVTCQRNVPALPSITSSTRTGITVTRCGLQKTPRAAAPYLVDW
eukprot:superscaffoldBa00001211_g9516